MDDEPSIVECTATPEGGLYIIHFLHCQEVVKLVELLTPKQAKQAGLIDNGCSLTDIDFIDFSKAEQRTSILCYMEYGEEITHWWKMSVEHPMMNAPKFHRYLHQRFFMPYTQFIQFVSDTKQNNWFPCWSRWSSLYFWDAWL
jgi:hypothetical protein